MRKKVILLILVLLLGGAGTYYFISGRESGLDEGRLMTYGNVDIRDVNLSFRVSGRIVDLLVEEGDAVRAGDEVGILDPEPYRHQLASARAREAALEAEVSRLEDGFRQEEIAQAEAKLRQTQAALELARRELKRQRELAASQASPVQRLDNAEAAHAEAEAGEALAQANLDLLRAGFRSEEIAAAKARLEEAGSEVARNRLLVEDCRLVAPAKGVVMVRAAEPGTIVGAGQTVLVLSLTDRTWVRSYIPENRLGRIHPGMRVEVFTDSTGEKAYPGQIGFISPQAEFTPKNVETEELRSDLVYRFRVVLDKPDDNLRQGMPVTVRLFPGEEGNVE